MNYIDLGDIHEPIWYGNKGRHISIGTYKVKEPSAMYRFGIDWKNKDDIQRYTKKFVMRGRDIMSYEAKPYKKYPDTQGYWIPLKDLQEEPSGQDVCIPHNAIKLSNGLCPIHIMEQEEC